jgi:hypothetical protein
MLSAVAIVNTDQGDYEIRNINFPVGTTVGDMEEYINDAIYQQLVNSQLSFEEEEGELIFRISTLRKSEFSIDENFHVESENNPIMSIIIDHEMDFTKMTQDDVRTMLLDKTLLTNAIVAFIEYLQEFSMRLNILKSEN